jgi:hypothetical protein
MSNPFDLPAAAALSQPEARRPIPVAYPITGALVVGALPVNLASLFNFLFGPASESLAEALPEIRATALQRAPRHIPWTKAMGTVADCHPSRALVKPMAPNLWRHFFACLLCQIFSRNPPWLQISDPPAPPY